MNLKLYLADEFRTLEGGKILALGLYTDHSITVNVNDKAPDPNRQSPYGVPLSLLVCIENAPENGVSFEATIRPPISAPQMKVRGEVPSHPGGAAGNLILKFDPFLIPEAGKYSVDFIFGNGVELSAEMSVRVNKSAEFPLVTQPGRIDTSAR
jgi:hypothetical protein